MRKKDNSGELSAIAERALIIMLTKIMVIMTNMLHIKISLDFHSMYVRTIYNRRYVTALQSLIAVDILKRIHPPFQRTGREWAMKILRFGFKCHNSYHFLFSTTIID